MSKPILNVVPILASKYIKTNSIIMFAPSEADYYTKIKNSREVNKFANVILNSKHRAITVGIIIPVPKINIYKKQTTQQVQLDQVISRLQSYLGEMFDISMKKPFYYGTQYLPEEINKNTTSATIKISNQLKLWEKTIKRLEVDSNYPEKYQMYAEVLNSIDNASSDRRQVILGLLQDIALYDYENSYPVDVLLQ